MKTKFLLAVSFSALFAVSANSQIKVDSDGEVGINNNSPGYQLDIELDETKNMIIRKDGEGYSGNPFNTAVRTGRYEIGINVYYPTLYPDDDFCLGKDGDRFDEIYGTNVICNSLTEDSDIRYKTNIEHVDSGLSKIVRLNPIYFDYSLDKYFNNSKNEIKKQVHAKSFKNRIGFSAQEVENIIPEVVTYDTVNDKYGINYLDIIPVVVKAIQEQQAQLSTKDAQIDSLTDKINSLENRIAALENNCCSETKNLKSATNTNTTGSEIQDASLYQNQPNPFTNETNIGFYLPASVNKATLYIYNMQGKQINNYQIDQRGNGSLTIAGGTLEPGMYMYALIADGKEVDTKRMILTE
jgi:hypothetical protein